MYSRVRASGRANGCPYQPSTTCGPDTPNPSTKRPFERWSRVSACIAQAAGVRAESCATDVPSRTDDVLEPHQASGVKASDPQDSAAKTASNPASSAASTSLAASRGGSAPQYPSCSPSFIAAPPASSELPSCRMNRERVLLVA